jgi:uncharacterized protein
VIDWPLLVVGAVVAGLVQGISGFGFSMVAISIWVWAMPPSIIALLAVFGGLVGQLIAVFTVKRQHHWALLAPYLVGGFVGIPIGVGLLPYLNPNAFKITMGLLLAICCPLMMLTKPATQPRKPNSLLDLLAGFGGGLTGGLGGFSGMVPTLWCTLQSMNKDTQRSVIQTFNLSTLAMAMAGYVLTGAVSKPLLLPMGVVGISLLVPVLIGARVYKGMNPLLFRKVVLGLLTVSGVAMVGAGVRG